MVFESIGGRCLQNESVRPWRARTAIGISMLLLFGCGRSDDRREDVGDAGEAGASAAAGGGSGGGAGAAGRGGSGKGGSAGKGGSTGKGGRGGSGGEDSGGNAGTAGAGGAAGGGFATMIRPAASGKVDVLLMIDNSLSMSDKHQLLADSLPVLVDGLQAASLNDVHVGIITSSLGHHGSKDICADLTASPTYDDRAELLPSVRQNLSSWDESGFLAWDPGETRTPPGLASASELVQQLSDHVMAVGEAGCGYEASLEAWYRFLIDPEPVAAVDTDMVVSIRLGTNAAVLEQRRRFLRPDSQLAIVMLTDENDCSIEDEAGSQGWLVGYKGGPAANSWRMPEATASCAAPNSPCCRPCVSTPATGCPGNDEEGCSTSGTRSILEDAMTLRCFQQKQRFGVDLLYPVQRYIDGLTKNSIEPRLDGRIVPNPLFLPPNSEQVRTPDMVVLLGIVGVPWQDVATAESLTDQRELALLPAARLTQEGRWEIALGDPANGVLPRDPFMIESIEPRTEGASHPLVATASISAADESTRRNAINGHELETSTQRSELQYACIFPLREPIPCTTANAASCDCNADEFGMNSPLCSYPAANTDGVQEFAKAYPSIRPLEVIRGLGDGGIVSSVCPKNVVPAPGTTPASDPNYGYNPAISALLGRLQTSSAPSCLSRPLAYDSTSDGDRVACHLVQSGIQADGSCSCDESEGRELLGEDSPTLEAVLRTLAGNGLCGGSPGVVCGSPCMCEVRQLEGQELTACQKDLEEPAGGFGFCYVDGASTNANPDLLRDCSTSAKRRIRLVGSGQTNSYAYLACPDL